jgi:NCS1 family nucleobase:cation symporter-1
MAIGMAVSILLFSKQQAYTGPVPTHIEQFGDSTFEVGFLVSAGLYWIGFHLQGGKDREETLTLAPAGS